MITKTKAIDAAVGEAKKIESTTHEKTVEGIKHAATTAAAGFEQAQHQVKEGIQKAVKTAEQITAFNQGNVEAFVKSSQIFTAGLTEISKLIAATTRTNIDETLAAFKALTTVKSVKEAVELQTSFARTSLEKAVSESGKITEHSLKLAEQTFAPLTARVNAAVETFS
jgi:phasin family protein